MSLPFNITNPGIFIDGLLTSAERSYVTDLVLAGATASENDVLTWKSGAPSWEASASGGGDVVGPVSAVNGRIVTFSGTTGKIIQDGGLNITQVRDRTNHTGTQLSSTISDFNEAAQDAVGGILLDSQSIDFDYNDVSNQIQAFVRRDAAGSLVSGVGGISLSGDQATPGNLKLYGTDASGVKGWYDQPSGGGGGAEWVVVSSNKTAVLDEQYHNVASATYTDPSPTEGKGFIVFVRNGTATVGGTGYSTAGTIVHRIFHSGAWANYVYQVSSTFALASHTHTVSQITDFPTLAPVATSNNYNDLSSLPDIAEEAQDAVATILTSAGTIGITYDDTTPSISLDVNDGTISAQKMVSSNGASFFGKSAIGPGGGEEIDVPVSSVVGRGPTGNLTALTVGPGIIITDTQIQATGVSLGQVLAQANSIILV